MRVNGRILLLAATLSGFLFAELRADDIQLVKNGKPASTIVTASKPTRSAQLAVAELNHYMKKITGTELPVKKDDEKVSGNMVLVGESKYTKELGLKNSDFKKQEYLIKTFPGKLVLMGRDGLEYGKIDYEGSGLWKGWGVDGWFTKPVGTVYAVHDFLRKFCGIRWYLPTDIGEVVPKEKTLIVGNIDVRRQPDIKYRDYASRGYDLPKKLYADPDKSNKEIEKLPLREKNLFFLRHKEGGRGFTCNHSFRKLQKKLSKMNPECGALQPDGSRSFRQLCYLDKTVQDKIMEKVKAKLAKEKANPDRNPYDRKKYIALVPDDYKMWCVCPKCSKYFDPKHKNDYKKHFSNGYASNYVFTFVKQMAEKIKRIAPEKQVTAAAYWDYYLPPSIPGFKLPDNVAVMLCRTNLTSYGPLFSEEGYRKEDMLKWKSMVKDLYAWEYVLFPQRYKHNLFPVIVPHRIAEAMRVHKEVGTKGIFFQRVEGGVKMWRHPAMEHLYSYMAMTLCDDINQNPDKILDEYYRLFFGPAAEPMKKFNEEMERLFVQGRAKSGDSGAEIVKIDANYCWTKMCPPGKLRELEGYFAEAKKLAKEEPYKSRVGLLDKAILQFMKTHSARTIRAMNVRVCGSSAYFQNKTGQIPGFDSPEWDKAIPLKHFYDKTEGLTENTKVKIINDDKNLYIMFDCKQKGKIIAKNKKRDVYMSDDNYVEIFLDPKNGDIYKQFIINPAGVVYDGKGRDSKWDSDIKTLHGKTGNGWYVIAQIPFSDISPKSASAPEARVVWGANFCRTKADMRGEPQSTLSWAPTTATNFHNPEKFGKLVFTK